MSKCCGLMGKIFGHSFENYLLKEGFNLPASIEGLTSEEILKILDESKNIYIIRCKRCGLELNHK